MRRVAIVAICLAALTGCSSPPPDDGTPERPSTSKAVPTEGEVSLGEITVTGTVEEGVESGCLLLAGFVLVQGQGHEPIEAGQNVKVTGRVDTSLGTTCQQGVALVVNSVQPA